MLGDGPAQHRHKNAKVDEHQGDREAGRVDDCRQSEKYQYSGANTINQVFCACTLLLQEIAGQLQVERLWVGLFGSDRTEPRRVASET